ncbi:unnamed protein product [Clonostachys rosea f. rosea IK726]|uniref:Uncharacterized protein n=1 Tax=Clonostachys rosea f. rosea IK726 TaxID=1349383 RepID=A0ACA9THM5_BIOOC|nr:unnamed protein product [Clonostachys rosea f. rosea IK726]
MAVAVQEAGHGVPHLCISQPRSRRPPDGWKEAIYSTRHFLVGGWDVSYLLDSARIEHSVWLRGLPHRRVNRISISTGCSM